MGVDGLSHLPDKYVIATHEKTEPTPEPDTMVQREHVFEGIEVALRKAYGDDPIDQHLWNVGKRYTQRRDDLEEALRKTYYPSVEKPLDNPNILQSNGTVLTALDQREHYTALAFALGDMDGTRSDHALFLTEAEDGSLKSPAHTPEGEAVTAIVRYICEHAPEVTALTRQTFPLTTKDTPDDPHRRLFYEHMVKLFFLKPPEEVHADHPNTMLWNRVLERDRERALFLLQHNDLLRHQHQELFNAWHEARPDVQATKPAANV